MQRVVTDGPDYGILGDAKFYRRYFAQVAKACMSLKHAYAEVRTRDGSTHEAQIESAEVEAHLNRFLQTLRALDRRSVYQDPNDRMPFIDLTDSGFPNYTEISNMEAHTHLAEEELRKGPADALLKRQLADALIRTGEDIPEHLVQLCQRSYYAMIRDHQKLFLTKTPIKVHFRGEEQKMRKYVATWGFYDPERNTPHLYILSFDQSKHEYPLEEDTEERNALMKVLQMEGSRAGDLLVMASNIDEKVRSVHPKVLKRLQLGPLYSRLLFEFRNPNELTPQESAMRELLMSGGHEDDVIALCRDEIIFSKRQEKLAGSMLRTLGFKKDTREIFYIPENDLVSYEKGYTQTHHFALMPHRVLQQLLDHPREELQDMLGPHVRKITYNERGEVNVI